jgi:hypothetical protein
MVVTGLNDPHAFAVPQVTDQVTSRLDVLFSTAALSCVALPIYSVVDGVPANTTEIGFVKVGEVKGA